MLVLTRKLMERLYIGDDICVTVVRLEGGQVRLGIEAPRNISVVRAELLADGGRGHLALAPRGVEPAGGAQIKAGVPVGETPACVVGSSPSPIAGGGVTPRQAGVPGIGTRLRGQSR